MDRIRSNHSSSQRNLGRPGSTLRNRSPFLIAADMERIDPGIPKPTIIENVGEGVGFMGGGLLVADLAAKTAATVAIATAMRVSFEFGESATGRVLGRFVPRIAQFVTKELIEGPATEVGSAIGKTILGEAEKNAADFSARVKAYRAVMEVERYNQIINSTPEERRIRAEAEKFGGIRAAPPERDFPQHPLFGPRLE